MPEWELPKCSTRLKLFSNARIFLYATRLPCLNGAYLGKRGPLHDVLTVFRREELSETWHIQTKRCVLVGLGQQERVSSSIRRDKRTYECVDANIG